MQAGRFARRLTAKEIEMRVATGLGHLIFIVTCMASMMASAQTVTSFTVVNADTETDIATFTSGGSVSIASTPRINVRANATGVGSVVFTDSTGARRVESTAPYAYKGNTGSDYAAWSPVVGTYSITATPFSGTGGTGTAGSAVTLVLTITGGGTSGGFTGKLMIDPDSVHHFVYDRDNDGDGKRDPAYLAGVGGPEGFLYESSSRQQTIVNKLLKSTKINLPVNGIYFHAVRSFGGDAGSDKTQTPFNNNADPNSGLSATKMAAWRSVLKQLDDAGIIMWFTLLDDHSAPYGCKFNDAYRKFAQDIVNQFKDLKHIIWVTQEEYRWTDGALAGCAVTDSDARQVALAAAIKAVDPIHPIGTHHMNGQAMKFGNDANIGVFGQQTRVRSPELMHDSAGFQGWGDWVYVMAEDHSWHQDLIDAELKSGTGRTLMRRSNWATAMSGGYVMMYNSFECGNAAKLCNSGPTDSDPTDEMLDDLRRLQDFMESTPFNRLTPLFANNGALTSAKRDGTKYILANQSAGLYILYGDGTTTKLGVNGAPRGTYMLEWFDPVDGTAPPAQTGTVGADGIASFTRPAGIGNEAVLYMRKL
jgi:hypothetical protein